MLSMYVHISLDKLCCIMYIMVYFKERQKQECMTVMLSTRYMFHVRVCFSPSFTQKKNVMKNQSFKRSKCVRINNVTWGVTFVVSELAVLRPLGMA